MMFRSSPNSKRASPHAIRLMQDELLNELSPIRFSAHQRLLNIYSLYKWGSDQRLGVESTNHQPSNYAC